MAAGVSVGVRVYVYDYGYVRVYVSAWLCVQVLIVPAYVVSQGKEKELNNLFTSNCLKNKLDIDNMSNKWQNTESADRSNRNL